MTDPLVVGPAKGHEHTHTVIFLHGRDSDAKTFAEELFESEASDDIPVQLLEGQLRTLPNLFPTIRWVFPSAPIILSQRFETSMPQWFDMWSVENPNEKSELQEQGLRESITLVKEVIAREEERIPRNKIFLAGISQGFATAISTFLTTFLTDDERFAGLIGLCGWLPLTDGDAAGTLRSLRCLVAEAESNGSRIATPIFLGHSADDEVVPIGNGRQMYQTLQALFGGECVRWHEYKDGGHWVNEPQGVDDLFQFLNEQMSC